MNDNFCNGTCCTTFRLKLLALALAVALWLAVARDPVAEVADGCSDRISQHPGESGDQLRRAFRGRRFGCAVRSGVVRRLQPADVSVDVELADMKPGERTFDLTARPDSSAQRAGGGANHSQRVSSHV